MRRSNAAWISGIRRDLELDENAAIERELYEHEATKIEVIDIEDLVAGTYEFNGYRTVSTRGVNKKKLAKRRADAVRGYPETKVEKKVRKWKERWEKFPPLERKTRIALWYLDEFLYPYERDRYCFECEGSSDKLVQMAYDDCMEMIDIYSMNDHDPARFEYLVNKDPIPGQCDWHQNRPRITIKPEIPEYLMDAYDKWLDKHPLESFAEIPEKRRKFLRKYLKEDRKEQDKILYGSRKRKKEIQEFERKMALLNGEPLFSSVPEKERMLRELEDVKEKTDEICFAMDGVLIRHFGIEHLDEREKETLRENVRRAKEMTLRCRERIDNCAKSIVSTMAQCMPKIPDHLKGLPGVPNGSVTLCMDDGREIEYDCYGNVVSERYNERGDLRKHRTG